MTDLLSATRLPLGCDIVYKTCKKGSFAMFDMSYYGPEPTKSHLSYYPDFGPLKYKLLFNQQIDPRPPVKRSNGPIINILFCREGPRRLVLLSHQISLCPLSVLPF